MVCSKERERREEEEGKGERKRQNEGYNPQSAISWAHVRCRRSTREGTAWCAGSAGSTACSWWCFEGSGKFWLGRSR